MNKALKNRIQKRWGQYQWENEKRYQEPEIRWGSALMGLGGILIIVGLLILVFAL